MVVKAFFLFMDFSLSRPVSGLFAGIKGYLGMFFIVTASNPLSQVAFYQKYIDIATKILLILGIYEMLWLSGLLVSGFN